MIYAMGEGQPAPQDMATAFGNSRVVNELLHGDEVNIPIASRRTSSAALVQQSRTRPKDSSSRVPNSVVMRPASHAVAQDTSRHQSRRKSANSEELFSSASEPNGGNAVDVEAAAMADHRQTSCRSCSPKPVGASAQLREVEQLTNALNVRPSSSLSGIQTRSRPVSSADDASLTLKQPTGREAQRDIQEELRLAAPSGRQERDFDIKANADTRVSGYANATRYNSADGGVRNSGNVGDNGYFTSDFSLQPQRSKKALGKFTKVACLTVSPQWPHVLFLVCVVLLFGLIFLTSVVPRGEVYSYVIGSVFMFLSLACLFLCVCIDPGIIPPAPRPAEPLQPEFVTIKGVEIECRPCRTCNIIRPPRSNHCKFTDVCVEEFDHFCPVVGSLVARRTYRFFGGFFIVTTVLCFYMFIRSIILLHAVRNTFQNSTFERWQFAAAILCVMASFVGGCFVVTFSFVYINMACLNTTQKENLRRQTETRVTQTRSTEMPVGNAFGLGISPHQDQPLTSHETNFNPGNPEGKPEPCGGAFSPNVPYAGNPCIDCLTRFFGPIGRSKIPRDYYV